MIMTLYALAFAAIPAALYAFLASGLSARSLAWGYGTGAAVLVSGIFWLFWSAIYGGEIFNPIVIMLSGLAVCFKSEKALRETRQEWNL